MRNWQRFSARSGSSELWWRRISTRGRRSDRASGRQLDATRRAATLEEWEREQRGHSQYFQALERLLSLGVRDLMPLRDSERRH